MTSELNVHILLRIVIGCANFAITVVWASSSFDNDCVPTHTNGAQSCQVQIICYEMLAKGNSRGMHKLWNTNVFINGGNDSVFSFRMTQSSYEYDPEWGFLAEQPRNLTMWLDEQNRLSLSMSNFDISRKLDVYTDYDIVDTKRFCATSTDILGIGFIHYAFHHHKYFQFGTIYQHWQTFAVSYFTY